VITFEGKKPVKTGIPQYMLPPLPEVIPATGLQAYIAESEQYLPDDNPAAPPTWVGIYASMIGK
jgi:hypothetical protein